MTEGWGSTITILSWNESKNIKLGGKLHKLYNKLSSQDNLGIKMF